MNKNERMALIHTFNAMESLGFTFEEFDKLRRISRTLRRWFELECGNSNDYASWAIERDEETGLPYMVTHHYTRNEPTRYRIADRETGAMKRLAALMSSHPTLRAYIQGDPRGAALYILRPQDVPEGADAGHYYYRGICID